MRSKLHLKSHPLHPIMVGFPIAFFIGTLVFDGLARLQADAAYAQTARHLNLAGIITAVLAAVPGIADFLFRVPPASSGKKRAAKHGVLNVVVLLLFTAVWFYRRDDAVPGAALLAAEAVGVALLGVSGWLGGTLVYRNEIGVDHRYAGAGKWKEKHLEEGDGPLLAGSSDELGLNQMMLVHAGGRRIVIGKTENGYVAFDDHCTHRGGSLADGAMICGTVQCPWHGSQFDCRTGAVKAGPAKEPIPTYEVDESGGKLYLRLPR